MGRAGGRPAPLPVRVYARYAILNAPDPGLVPIAIEVWEPDPENPGCLQYAGNRPVGDVLREPSQRLEAEGLLPEEGGMGQVYRMFEPQAEFPRYWRLACYAVTGASDGHYVHVDALVVREDAKPPDVEAVPVFLGKTFRGMDFACRVAAACVTGCSCWPRAPRMRGGYRQWEQVGRHVRKGAKAFHIFAPVTRKITVKVADPETGEEREETREVLVGFREVPVFRYEDTEGKPLPEPDYAPPEPPPLQDVARAFGVREIRYEPASGHGTYGFYSWTGGKRIVLHSHDVAVWFHELGHAIHHSFRPLRGGQMPEQEIVAEIFAATMCILFGMRGHLRNAWEYVKAYAG